MKQTLTSRKKIHRLSVNRLDNVILRYNSDYESQGGDDTKTDNMLGKGGYVI